MRVSWLSFYLRLCLQDLLRKNRVQPKIIVAIPSVRGIPLKKYATEPPIPITTRGIEVLDISIFLS
tara:strand:+ start:379 stop:576 length:198 start_codon:yes stop_codon:yes gene_type:complete